MLEKWCSEFESLNILFESHAKFNLDVLIIVIIKISRINYKTHYTESLPDCQRASQAKMRGWRGGSIIELYEDSIQVIQILSVCKRCSVRIIGPIRSALRTVSKLQPMGVR